MTSNLASDLLLESNIFREFHYSDELIEYIALHDAMYHRAPQTDVG